MEDEFEDFDDGWRHCERCFEGFTIWFERIFDNEKQDNGYVNEELLCEKCFAKVQPK